MLPQGCLQPEPQDYLAKAMGTIEQMPGDQSIGPDAPMISVFDSPWNQRV
jgi:hypothetical protein